MTFVHAKAQFITFLSILKLYWWLIPIWWVISSFIIFLLYFLVHFSVDCWLSFNTLHRHSWSMTSLPTVVTYWSMWWAIIIKRSSVMTWHCQFHTWVFVVESCFSHWWQLSSLDRSCWAVRSLLWTTHFNCFFLGSTKQCIASKLAQCRTILCVLFNDTYIFFNLAIASIALRYAAD